MVGDILWKRNKERPLSVLNWEIIKHDLNFREFNLALVRRIH